MSEKIAVGQSTIPGAGLGAFARHDLAASAYLGKYKGQLLKSNERKRLENYDYVFELDRAPRRGYCCIDASDPEKSNWTRYMNCSRNPFEENVTFVEKNNEITFYTKRPVRAGEELLFYYGVEYARRLGIRYIPER